MLRFVFACVAALLATGSLARGQTPPDPAGESPKATLDEPACQKLWNMAAGRSDLGPDQAKRYVSAFEKVDVNGDHKITNKEFKIGCAAGFVHTPAKTEAPAAGAGSQQP